MANMRHSFFFAAEPAQETVPLGLVHEQLPEHPRERSEPGVAPVAGHGRKQTPEFTPRHPQVRIPSLLPC